MTRPPDGERPGGEEPFEGISPDELDDDLTPVDDSAAEDSAPLEPEFVEALRQAENGGDEGDGGQPGAEQSESDPAAPASEQSSGDRSPDGSLEAEEVAGSDSGTADAPAEHVPGGDSAEEAAGIDSEQREDPEQAEPALGGSAAPKADDADAATAEQPLPQSGAEDPSGDGATVEFTPDEVAAAQGDGEADAETPADAESETDDAEDEASDTGDGEGTEEARRTVVIESATTATVPPAAFEKPPADGDGEPAPRRKRIWLRFLVGSVLILASMAGATAASALYFLGHVADDLGGIKGVQKQLLPPQTGEPENILILGSDKRASEPGTKGLSDTTILLRLDPDNNSIALMSIPRDLKTYIPGVGTTKFNAAYAYGGPKLTLNVVKRITGLSINHVVNVDFLGFQRAVNAIGCVYVDVDRRYYHSNVGLPPSLQYSEINIQPGYQKLCGKDALAYARYRHTDTDLVRAARQQDFLREARQQVPPEDLFITKRKKLLDIFTHYTTSDISNGETLLQVLKLFVASRNAPIKEIHFPALLHPSYVTASKPAIEDAIQKFLGIEASGGPRGSLPASSGNTGIVPEEKKRAKAKKNVKKGAKAPPTPTTANDGLVPAGQFSHDLAAKVAARTLRSFPVFYPRRLPSGAIYVQVPRVYHFRDTDKERVGAYKMVLQLPQGDYFGFQGVRGWTDPPILNSPSETRTINGREFDIYLDGDRVRLIAWHQGDNSYWVSNSLLQSLSNDQMLGIARSIAKLPGQRTHQHKKKGQGKK